MNNKKESKKEKIREEIKRIEILVANLEKRNNNKEPIMNLEFKWIRDKIAIIDKEITALKLLTV